MPLTMKTCSECNRHFYPRESACPFCDAPAQATEPGARSLRESAVVLGAAALLAASAAACGDAKPAGTPPNPVPSATVPEVPTSPAMTPDAGARGPDDNQAPVYGGPPRKGPPPPM